MTCYKLNPSDYTWKNALLWGNYSEHCKKSGTSEYKGACESEEFTQVRSNPEEALPEKRTVGQGRQTIDVAEQVHNVSQVLLEKEIVKYPWDDEMEIRLACGKKHDSLMELESVLEETSACIPEFFGFTNEQIQSLLSEQTIELWQRISSDSPLQGELPSLLSNLQKSVEKDILLSRLPLSKGQRRALEALEGKTLIVRSSSNEDGTVVNAGGNDSIVGVEAKDEALIAALARVVSSYFSLQSFQNRSAFEDPFKEFPLCSVLVMEQVTENASTSLPIVSGVMMTNKTAWSSSGDDGITHISASWGFGSGTSNGTICDEWALTDSRSYSTIRRKLHRLVTSSFDVNKKEPNDISLREVPCLSGGQLTQLRDIAKKLETHFKQPMDVEFVISSEKLYIVQVRPIQASNIAKSNYLNPTDIPDFLSKFNGEVIVAGTNQVLSLNRSEIVFARDLEEAEQKYSPKFHKAVVVYTHESSTTHPAVNFASQRPPVPCLVLPYEQWLECQETFKRHRFQLCPQTGVLVEIRSNLPVREGLFLHPARFPITISKGNPIQAESHNPTIIELRQLLNAVPEVLKDRLDEINDKINQVFFELSKRKAITTNFKDTAEQLRKASLDEIEEMRSAAKRKQMTQLAFHAGMLRQLVDQSGKQIIGAHSISGLEVHTYLPNYIDEFIRKRESSPTLCKLALLGLNGFDESVQRKWLEFLETNSVHQLELLLEDLQCLDSFKMLTHWFSLHFSCSSLPNIDELLIENETNRKTNSTLFDFENSFSSISESIKAIGSRQDLEHVWKLLHEQSDAFLEFCKENQLKHPLILELIDIWDVSTKAVQVSKLFSIEEEAKLFKSRVRAFTDFACQASKSNVLNYSLEELIESMRSYGKIKYKFSVQHWLIPISHGALSSITTDDQWLTVIHQNLLQAAAYDNPKHLPLKLATAYDIFKENNKCLAKCFDNDEGTFISIGKDQASVRINIPLNYHSTVVTLSQNKGCDEIDVTTYFRGFDNGRTYQLNFFEVLSKLANIPLKEIHVLHPNIKITLAIKNKEEASLLSRAIDRVNEMSLHGANNFGALCFSFDPDKKDRKSIKEKIIRIVWEKFKQSATLMRLDDEIDEMIWEFLKGNDQLSEIITPVIDELKGRQPKTDFSRLFTRLVLEHLPIEESKDLVWQDLIGNQWISLYCIPKNIKDDLLTNLFKEVPAKAKLLCKYEAPPIFIELISKMLDTDGLKTRDEAALLFHIALNCTEEIPAQWIEALKACKTEDIASFIKEKQEGMSFTRHKNLQTLLTAISPEST